ncbi:MAG: nucleoside triphosphate pyrophosphohydrolase [Caldithrix sp.]|nr:nucleoside triphosphate pyrophosphohydrolase [Caldithrix sp.]
MTHPKKPKAANDINYLLDIMQRLRKECPWDAKQTHQSLKQYLLEEAYEVLESIDDQSWEDLRSELGDLLLQVVFHSQIATEHKRFTFEDVVKSISEKLVKRHPHVFAEHPETDARTVQNNWEHSKIKEEGRHSVLDGIPGQAPALLQAQRMQEKAATVGFDWKHHAPVLEKIEEEIGELKAALQKNNPEETKNEYGDLMFSMVNLARFLQINAEDALRGTNHKFARRFKYIEQQYQNSPDAMRRSSLDEMDRHWENAKNIDENNDTSH